MENYIQSAPHAFMHVTIDGIDPIRGKIYNAAIKDPVDFIDFNELIIKGDQMFNSIGNPMPSVQLRSFRSKKANINYQASPKLYHDYHELMTIPGKKTSMDIYLKSRHEAGWQGYLLIDGKCSQFHGIMELLNVMNTEVLS